MISPKDALELVQTYGPYLRANAELIDILEGNLLPYVDAELKKQLNPQSYFFSQYRVMPINILPKIIDKLTNIYQTSVVREVVDGTDADQELVDWYVDKLQLNDKMNCANELYNMCKSTLLYPYVYNMEPYLRVILNDRFVVSSSNNMEPTEPTDVVICAGKKNGQDLFWVYGEDGFYVMNGTGARDTEEMLKVNNPMGINPYGTLPFVYTSDSKYKLMPTQDTDLCKIVKILPIMLTDLNLAAMFQSFSIIYGINVDDENLAMVPGAFWRFKSDPTSDIKPEIGTIKPQVDFNEVLNLIQSELSMWLGSRGIRASSIGTNIGPDQFASGISKVIDEMDTYEARQKQVTVFTELEKEFWELLLTRLHPEWVATGQIENRTLPSAGMTVKTTFAVQLPMQSRGQIVLDLKNEVAAGFTTRERAIEKLNPQLSSAEIEELMLEIDQERGILPQDTGANDGMATDQTSGTGGSNPEPAGGSSQSSDSGNYQQVE